jgi:hypothetical protein
MRILWLIGCLAVVSACSSYGVRCNKHLRPINVPDRTASAMAPSGPVSSARSLLLPGTPAAAPGSNQPAQP